MGDQCAACCREYQNHIEAERLARRDLERRFEAYQREMHLRRETLTRQRHTLHDVTQRLQVAESQVEALSASLAEWQRLAQEHALMTLAEALEEVRGFADPFDVPSLEHLPEAQPCAA